MRSLRHVPGPALGELFRRVLPDRFQHAQPWLTLFIRGDHQQTLIDQILYALYRPPAAAQATCEVVEHFLYCLAPGADRTPVPAVPQPSAPANGKLGFDIWVHFAPRFLALSPADRARRLACYNLPWRPNDLNLWRTNNGRVDFVARHGDLTLVRSHYAAA